MGRKDKIIFVPNWSNLCRIVLYILKWCEDNNVQVVDGTKIQDTKVDDSKVDAFIKALKIPFAVRDYQKEAFVYATKKNRCLLLSPRVENLLLLIFLLGLTYFG